MSICKLVNQWQTFITLQVQQLFQKLSELSASDFSTVSLRRQFCVCAFECLTKVTNGVVNDVYKVVIWSSFGVIQ